MPIQKINNLPSAPDRRDPDNFPAKGDIFMSALDPMVSQINVAIDGFNNVQLEVDKAQAASIAATNAAANAQATAGAAAWVSGTTYAKNVCAISQLNFQTYRRKVAGSGTVDPMNDGANWAMLAGDGAFVPQVASTSTFNLSLGNYFTKTVSASETWSFINVPSDGYSFTVEVKHTGGVLTLPSTVKTPGDIAYTLTPGKTHLFMFSTVDRGVTRWRMVAAPNFTD